MTADQSDMREAWAKARELLVKQLSEIVPSVRDIHEAIALLDEALSREPVVRYNDDFKFPAAGDAGREELLARLKFFYQEGDMPMSLYDSLTEYIRSHK